MPMPKKVYKKSTDAKKRRAFIMNQLNKSPKKLAQEAEESVRRKFFYDNQRKAEQERLGLEQESLSLVPEASSVNESFFFEDYETGIQDTPLYQRTTTRETWERYTTEKLVTLYVVSLAKGKPSLALTNPQQEQYTCQCTDKRTKSVTLYMMCAHVERTLNYCGCKPLVEVLFEMQFLASSGKSPNVAIHFAMLNYLHVTKMIEQTATHGFTQIANIINEDDKPLQKDVLNNVYLLYRRIISHSTDLMNKACVVNGFK